MIFVAVYEKTIYFSIKSSFNYFDIALRIAGEKIQIVSRLSHNNDQNETGLRRRL